MDAAQALADLTEVSTQIQGAVLAEAGGKVLASTFPAENGSAVVEAALELLRTAGETRGEPARSELAQVLAATGDGSVFLVRDERHVVAAVTAPDPTVGLIFYDLKTCLRLLEPEKPKPARAKREAKQPDTAGVAGGGRKRSGAGTKKATGATGATKPAAPKKNGGRARKDAGA